MTQISEEANKIIKYIVKSSPYGQHLDLLKDLQKLTPFNTQDQNILAFLKDHNQEHLAVCEGSDDKIITFNVAADQEGRYIDQVTGKAYTVDHLNQKIVSIEAVQLNLQSSIQNLLTATKSALQNYLDKYYKNSKYGSFVYINQDESPQIFLALTSKNLKFSNFYGGEWISKWKVSNQLIQGTINIHAHFFEAGNVQFHQTKKFQQKFVLGGDAKVNASKIISVIEKFEGDLQRNLNDVYEDMPNKFFKALRRLQPVTKTKMIWNLNALKMKQNLK